MKGIKVFIQRYIAFLLCIFMVQAKAQTKHVIYIQTEDKKPFFVTVNDQTKNSTESGYIILPKLADSSYFITIGSPDNEFPEQKFLVKMNDSDWEFAFRKNDTGGYELYDMIRSTALNIYKETEVKPVAVAVSSNLPQDSVQQKATAKVDTVTTIPQQKITLIDTSVTSDSMQNAAQQTPAITDTATVVAEQKVTLKDTSVALQPQQVNAVSPVSVPVKAQQSASKNKNLKVNKIFERVSAEGVDLIFVDERKPKFDTIAIYVPIVRNNAVQEERPKKVAEPVKPKPVTATPTPEQPVAVVAAKQRCANVAGDDDFLSVRKQMASANSEEEMLATAKNSFAEKCFSVAQIKNLSVLFLNEKNKFSFFRMARPATVDSKDFYKLINQLTQPDLIEKFAALIQQ